MLQSRPTGCTTSEQSSTGDSFVLPRPKQHFPPRPAAASPPLQIMRDLSFGAEWQSVAEKYIPGGSYGNGGAMRIAPVGLAYRNAPPQVRYGATHCLPTLSVNWGQGKGHPASSSGH